MLKRLMIATATAALFAGSALAQERSLMALEDRVAS